MTTENMDLGKLEKKVDTLAQELAEVRKEVKALSTIDVILKDLSKQISQIEKIDHIIKSLTDVTNAVKDTAHSEDITALSTKLDKIEDHLI